LWSQHSRGVLRHVTAPTGQLFSVLHYNAECGRKGVYLGDHSTPWSCAARAGAQVRAGGGCTSFMLPSLSKSKLSCHCCTDESMVVREQSSVYRLVDPPPRPRPASPFRTATTTMTKSSPWAALARRHVDEFVPLSAFFWNVHWECSMGARGASKDCKSHIGRRFRELATASQADVVTSIELADSASRPTRLKRFGFDGWTQVDGPCKKSRFNGDAAALALAPGWTVQGSAGGCLRRDSDSRAFAVARVRPPTAVKGCPSLCVVALHAPHQAIDHGKELVRDVCGSLVDNCTVAMGDWNAPAEDIGSLWEQLIGGNVPVEAKPNERTCCWPESHHYGIFDHLATNIPGAIHDNHTVHPYQLLHLSPMKQHKAVSARLLLPREA